MKFSTILRTTLFVSLLALAVGCASKAEPEASIYHLEGVAPDVYYVAPSPLTEGSDCEVAAIVLQGWHGGVQVLDEQISLQNALGNAYVIGPMFPRPKMMERYGIEPDGRAIWNVSWERRDLSIPGSPEDDWRGGGDAVDTELSSFDVIDILIERLSDKILFPNIKRIAVIGFSAGGQFVGRYVAVGKGVAREGIELRYAAMAPSTFLTLEPNDTWHYGLKNRPRYSREISHEQILSNLRSRRCLHGCGLLDTLSESLDQTSFAMKQGENRYVRFQNFQNTVNQDPEWKAQVTFYTFETIGHEAVKAYADPFFVNYIKGE